MAEERFFFTLPFDALRLGMHWTTSARTVTETDLVCFAALTGDWHAQHVDEEWARRAEFGERIAHGLLVLSYAAGLLPLDSDRVMALRAVSRATFKRATRIGDTIRVQADVARLKPLDGDMGLVTLGLRVLNQADETVLLASLVAVWRSAPPRPRGEAAEPRPVADRAVNPR